MIKDIFGAIFRAFWTTFKKDLWRSLVAVALVLALIAGVIIALNIKPSRQIAMFESGVPGTSVADEALQFAADSHVDAVINYSILNASNEAIASYLDKADKLGVKIIVSLKDLLTNVDTDADENNRQLHANQGPTTYNQVETYVRYFSDRPAVAGFFFADEPEGHIKDVLPLLERRRDQIKGLTSKPVYAAIYLLSKEDRDFSAAYMKEFKKGTDQLMMDYYPYPSSGNGPGNYGDYGAIPGIARDVAAAAGNDSWFNIQAFSYKLSEPAMFKKFGFPDAARQGLPDAGTMVDMAKMALAGGVRHLGFFSYGYAKQGGQEQLDQLKEAIRQVRDLPEFKN